MERIGFIGLGIMGKPMARNLLRAGYPLVVHSRSPGPVDEMAKEGAKPALSPHEVAGQTDIVITMLPDSRDVQQVMTGPAGVFASARPGMLLIDMSTISPLAARQLGREAEARGAAMLDAPVSGGETGAIDGTLSIMVGGRADAFARALPVFRAMGKNIVHIGEAGAGQIAKAANQIVVALTIEAVGEALVLAIKAGVDPTRVREALLGGFAQSRVLEIHGQRMLERNFKPGGRLSLHHKDLGIALAAGQEYRVALPLTASVHQMMNALIATGLGDWDHSALVTLLEEIAGIKAPYS